MRKAIDDVIYLIVDEARLDELEISREVTAGTTLFEKVNSAHIDLTKLSVADVAALATACAQHADPEFESGKNLQERLFIAVANGHCSEEKLTAGVRKKLEEFKGSKAYRALVRQGCVPAP